MDYSDTVKKAFEIFKKGKKGYDNRSKDQSGFEGAVRGVFSKDKPASGDGGGGGGNIFGMKQADIGPAKDYSPDGGKQAAQRRAATPQPQMSQDEQDLDRADDQKKAVDAISRDVVAEKNMSQDEKDLDREDDQQTAIAKVRRDVAAEKAMNPDEQKMSRQLDFEEAYKRTQARKRRQAMGY